MFIDKDLKGRVIFQNPKDGKSIEIDGDSRFCGHRFLLKTKLYGDKRCLYCGKWFHWQGSDKDKWIVNRNIDPHNLDNNIEPLHCGSSACEDYHNRWLTHQDKLAKEAEKMNEIEMLTLFSQLKAKGLVT